MLLPLFYHPVTSYLFPHTNSILVISITWLQEYYQPADPYSYNQVLL